MKRSLGVLIAFSAISVGAQAADLPSHKSSPPPYLIAPPPLWTGFYVGANLGGGVPNRGAGGVIGGGQLGYNHQFSPLFVAGLETDIQGSSMSGVHWFGTVRARLGTTIVSPKLLVYGTGGFAYGGSSGAGAGWTAGGGVEWAFAPKWSAKVEYLYVRLSQNEDFGPRRHGDQGFHVVRAGLNYRFDPYAFLSPRKAF
ncbi:outer membrane protein [Methylocystis suflitae]|uniref:outer membrane protein n=1 Tax=Methylocystis suflitae TaxID=2951405 RepID=UPI00210EFB54|nr:outer membrane beta-barrel protein [Methylocystis suflitae]MCQ4190607.1 outer membrane beta-barrel protein [Methylocystis suflitae]